MAEQKFPQDDGNSRAFTKPATTTEAAEPQEAAQKKQPVETEESQLEEKKKDTQTQTQTQTQDEELSEEEKCLKCRNDTLLGVGVVALLCSIAMLVLGGYIIVQVNTYYNPVSNLVLYILTNVATGLLVIGAFGVVTAILGMTIPACASLGLCLAFETMASSVLLATVVLLIYYGTQMTTLFSQAQESMLQNLAVFFTDYTQTGVGGTSTSVNTYAYYWNQVMFQLSCCGATSYADYSKATLWTKTYTINSVTFSAQVPSWCCVMNAGTSFAVPQFSDANCTVYATSSNSYMSVNCYTALLNAIQATTLSILAIVAAAVIALLFLLLVIAGAIGIHQFLLTKRATVRPQMDIDEGETAYYRTTARAAEGEAEVEVEVPTEARKYPTVVRMLGAQQQQSQRTNPILVSQVQRNSNFLQTNTNMYNANAFSRPVRYN